MTETVKTKEPLVLICTNPRYPHTISIPSGQRIPPRCTALSCKHELEKYDGRKHKQ